MFSHVKSEKSSVKCQSCKLIGKEDNWLNEINSYKINVCKQKQTLNSLTSVSNVFQFQLSNYPINLYINGKGSIAVFFDEDFEF